MQTLGKRKDTAATPALAQLAQNGDPQARAQAIRTLTEIGSPAAVPLLFTLLEDREADVSAAAHEGLAAFPGSQADQALLALINSPETKQRVAAIDLIQLRRTKSALPALKKAAEDPDPLVRQKAIEAVGKVGEAEDLPFLLARFPAFQDAAEIAVMETAFADLGIRSPDREACAGSLIALQGLSPVQQASIVRVLGILGGKAAIAAVRSSTRNGTPEVRDAGVRALASWKSPDAAPALLEMARTSADSTERLLTLRGYLRLASHADLALAERVSMAAEARPLVSSVEEKRMLLSLLQRNASTASISMAAGYLDDPEVKEEASLAVTAIAESIAEKKPGAVGPVLEKVVKTTSNKTVSDRAKAVLAKAGKILN